MSRQIQIRRGTATEHSGFTGVIGEVTMDTTNNTLRVHDGVTPGGNEIMSTNKFYSYATNCITEIKQDIKLELSSGALKLKSGSKIYVPNGTNTFDIVTLSEDKTVNISGQTGTTMIFLRNDKSVWGNVKVDNCLSGTTVPSGHTGMFYNTDNNKIYYYSGGQAQGAYFSLPLAVVTSSGGTVTSIDQVFNGFGYIGSIIFVLPGVKGLAPNGRNDNGTLNNYNINTTSVKIANAGNHKFLLNYNGVFDDAYYGNYIEQETMPSVNCTWYKPSTNIMYHVLSGVAEVKKEAMAIDVKTSGGKVTNLKPNLPFRAVDNNDREYIAHQSTPSDRYINLSWATSGSAYTMPADGYLTGRRNSDAVAQYLFVYKDTVLHGLYSFWSVGGSQGACFCVPVSKGDTIIISYTMPNAQQLQLFYTNGSK